MKEDRVAKAIALFKEGYNCSQSVVAAFADEYGFTREQALRMAASFGGGIGRMRETVGRLVACSCLPDSKPGLRKAVIVRERLPIMRWCRNWRKNSSAETVH